MVTGAFRTDSGQLTLANVSTLVHNGTFLDAFKASIELSVGTAVAGAIAGGLLAWAITIGNPQGVLRRALVAASGVLAQFGGVMLTFAFLATYGYTGLVTLAVAHLFGLNPYSIGHLDLHHVWARRRLHLLPDPTDGAHLPAGARQPAAAVAGGFV